MLPSSRGISGNNIQQFNKQDIHCPGNSMAVIQPMRPDCFSPTEQRHRLEELMAQWRTARDPDSRLSQTRRNGIRGAG
jgi:hypothetical protein